jgi:hypothetical protein
MENKMEDICDLPNGCHLFRKPNEAGGHTYYSDEIGGGVVVWDTCLVGEETLLTAIVEEKRRKYLEYHINRRLIGANKVWDLLVKEAGASENNRSEFLLWFKTSLPFYPQNLMVADKKQISREYRFGGKFGFGGKINFCNQMMKSHIPYYPSERTQENEEIIEQINKELKKISC